MAVEPTKYQFKYRRSIWREILDYWDYILIANTIVMSLMILIGSIVTKTYVVAILPAVTYIGLYIIKKAEDKGSKIISMILYVLIHGFWLAITLSMISHMLRS